MKTLRVFMVCLVAMLLSAWFMLPDDPVAVLTKKLWQYHQEHPPVQLYLHTDKTIYNTNEDIWFKAYILNHEADSSTVLYVRFTDQKKRVIIKDQFLITDIRANGDILIPDTLRDGSYYLYAYTNRMINYAPENVFVQRITITHNSSKRLYAEAAVLDTNQLKRGHKVGVQVKVKDGNDLLKNIKGEYRLMTNEGRDKIGKISTNQFGEASFNFIYPNLPDDQNLNVNISFKNTSGFADLTLNLKHEGNPIRVNLYPEGGHFIADIPTKVEVQATDVKQNPVAANITLKNGAQTIAHVRLNKNGQGILSFTPDPNAKYTIDAENYGNKNTIPFNGKIENKGYSLSIQKQNNDVKLTVKNVGADNNALLVLRSFDEVLWSQPVSVASGDSVMVTLPSGSVGKQVLNISAFDLSGNLLSERLFLNKMSDEYRVAIKTDQQVYGARKKVTVTINITDASGNPVATNLSVSAAEKERTDPAYQHDILDTWYLKFIDSEGHFNLLSGLAETNINNVLIARNWRSGQWNDVINYKPVGRIKRVRNTEGVVGYLLPLVKKPPPLNTLAVLSKSRVFPVALDDNKYFSIAYTDLIRERGEKEYLVLGAAFVDKYKLNILDYAGIFDTHVSATNALAVPQVFNTLSKYEEVKQSFAKGVIQLKEVMINGSGSVNIEIYQSKDCNDMVCMYNILNCANHPGCCTVPVDGGVYKLRGRTVIYKSCGEVDYKTHAILKCISIPKKFYLPDYDKEPSYEPELHSTIYWNPNLFTDKNGNVTFSFYTSDIAGDFLINAQGVEVRGGKPLSGKAIFKVR